MDLRSGLRSSQKRRQTEDEEEGPTTPKRIKTAKISDAVNTALSLSVSVVVTRLDERAVAVATTPPQTPLRTRSRSRTPLSWTPLRTTPLRSSPRLSPQVSPVVSPRTSPRTTPSASQTAGRGGRGPRGRRGASAATATRHPSPAAVAATSSVSRGRPRVLRGVTPLASSAAKSPTSPAAAETAADAVASLPTEDITSPSEASQVVADAPSASAACAPLPEATGAACCATAPTGTPVTEAAVDSDSTSSRSQDADQPPSPVVTEYSDTVRGVPEADSPPPTVATSTNADVNGDSACGRVPDVPIASGLRAEAIDVAGAVLATALSNDGGGLLSYLAAFDEVLVPDTPSLAQDAGGFLPSVPAFDEFRAPDTPLAQEADELLSSLAACDEILVPDTPLAQGANDLLCPLTTLDKTLVPDTPLEEVAGDLLSSLAALEKTLVPDPPLGQDADDLFSSLTALDSSDNTLVPSTPLAQDAGDILSSMTALDKTLVPDTPLDQDANGSALDEFVVPATPQVLATPKVQNGGHPSSSAAAKNEVAGQATPVATPRARPSSVRGVFPVRRSPPPKAALRYSSDHRIQFQQSVCEATSLRLLDLSSLEYTGRPYSVCPSWLCDDKLTLTLDSLQSGPSDVRRLDLGEAQWAVGPPFDDRLRVLLRKYRSSLVSLRVSVRALVERCGSHRVTPGKLRLVPSVNVLAEVAALPRLSRLNLVFDVVRCGRGASACYRNELVPGEGRFPRLRDVEVHLTDEWVYEHLPQRGWWCDGAVGCSSGSDEEGGLCDRDDSRLTKPEDDVVLMDLLRHRQEAVTVLDMVAVRRLPPTLALLLADLRNLRTLALRVDLVPFILGDSMTQLEVLTLELRAGSSPSSKQKLPSVLRALSGSKVLPDLRCLELRASGHAEFAEAGDQCGAVLAIVAERCIRLKQLVVSGSGWRPEELTAIVGLELPLRELNLAKCDALTATQIKQLPKLAVATLRRVRLPARLQDESAHTNALIRRGVDIRWL